jgi:hypothetical protein
LRVTFFSVPDSLTGAMLHFLQVTGTVSYHVNPGMMNG